MRQWIAIGAALGLVALSLPWLKKSEPTSDDSLAKGVRAATGPVITRSVTPPALSDLDLTRIDASGSVATAPAHNGRVAELTLNTKYQRAAMGLLRAGHVPEGAVVVTDVKTGKVLVWASYVDDGPARDVAREATAPAASVFKLVTGAALVESGVPPNTRQCYSGGEHSIRSSDLEDDEKKDKWCATLSQAMGRSLNTVFARLASKHLDRDKLSDVAKRLGYGVELPFDAKVETSSIQLPEDKVGFARTAAGFWNTTLSPFHAADLVTAIANGGQMLRLHIVSSVRDESGELYRGPTEPMPLRRVLDENIASAVTSMMEGTVDNGTSYKSFHDQHGRPYLPDIRVAGKTGTLTKPVAEGPYYTWFVGFAPSRAPEVAISVLVANRAKWRVKATNVACDMLRVYFADRGAPGINDPSERGTLARR